MEKIRQRSFPVIFFLISCGFLITGLSVLWWNDSHLDGQEFTFVADDGEILFGTYYPGKQPTGVLLLEGFGSDQVALKPLASELVSMGFHVMSFDFSGHGRSTGILAFDNAATDQLARQVMQAISILGEKANLMNQSIFLIGHSMGARVGLQASYLSGAHLGGLVLYGVQVNLDTSRQADFFTGVSDASLEWVQGLNATNPPMDSIIITGAWDDILPPKSAELLNERLSTGQTTPYDRDLVVLPAVVHNYEIYTPEAIATGKIWMADRAGLSPDSLAATKTEIRLAFWIVVVVSLFSVLISSTKIVKMWNLTRDAPKLSTEELDGTPLPPSALLVVDEKAFLRSKLKWWGGALLVFLGLASILLVIPLGNPLFNIIYVGFIGSYGLLLFVLYRKGKVAGMGGPIELDLKGGLAKQDWGRIGIALLIGVGIALVGTFFARTGIYFVFPLNDRVFWLVVFTTLTAFGFYTGQKEMDALGRLEGKASKRILLLMVVNFLPFFILTGFFAALGSLSGFIGALQGLLILALAILAGQLIQKISNAPLLTALFQAFLLQWLIVPQGALFSVFY